MLSCAFEDKQNFDRERGKRRKQIFSGRNYLGEIIGTCVQVDLRHKNPEQGAGDDWIIDSVNNLELPPVKQS